MGIAVHMERRAVTEPKISAGILPEAHGKLNLAMIERDVTYELPSASKRFVGALLGERFERCRLFLRLSSLSLR